MQQLVEQDVALRSATMLEKSLQDAASERVPRAGILQFYSRYLFPQFLHLAAGTAGGCCPQQEEEAWRQCVSLMAESSPSTFAAGQNPEPLGANNSLIWTKHLAASSTRPASSLQEAGASASQSVLQC